jgi:hypothetical protein
VKRIEYTVLSDFGMLLVVAAMCGGSDNVRYGRHGPETWYAAELQPGTNETIWIFVHIPGDGRIAAQVQWHDRLWSELAAHGIQTADCPMEIWVGSARFFRKKNIPAELLTLEAALAAHVDAKSGTAHAVEFEAP